ncbi:MAG: hypothetical protein KZQ90_10075 [Candidatus Thiodiazotropha sp. (ex Codakia rugifera)]|nr:hypothetical protein [Candidatus Thiodiazotropha sp. (ex Codakia rugifera)]
MKVRYKKATEKLGVYLSFSAHILLFILMLGKLSQSDRPLLSLISIATIVLISWSVISAFGYLMSKSWANESIITQNIVQVILTTLLPFVLYLVFVGMDEPDFTNLYPNSLNITLLFLGFVLICATSLMLMSKK